MEGTPAQLFVRNDKGKIWGPLEPQTVELLIDNGLIDGRIQVSEDGINFAFPGRFPKLRDFFPRHLWGADVPADPDAAPPPRAAPAAAILLGDAPPTPPQGAAPAAAAAGVPMAGPGAFAAAAARASQGRGPPPGPARPPPVMTPVGTPPGPAAATSAGTPVAARPAAAPPAAAASPRPAAATPAAAPPAAAVAAAPAAPATTAARPAPLPVASEPDAPLPKSGDLAKLSPIHLYYLAAAGSHSSLITFVLPDREIAVHFRRGNPEYVGSNHIEDALEAFLLRHGLVDAAAIGEAEAAKERFGGELIGALFGLGKLNAGSAFPQLASRRQALLLRALSAESGTFRVEEKELDPHRSMPLGNKWGVLTEALRRLPAPDLRRRLQGALDLPVMKSGGKVPVQDLRLTPQEMRAFSFMDGVRSLNQLMRDLPQETEHLLRVALLLKELEVVAFGAHAVVERPPPPAAPAAPATAAKAAPSGNAAAGAARPAAPATGAATATPAAAPRPPGAAPSAAKPAAAPPRPPAAAPAPKAAPPPPAEPAAPAPALSFTAQIDELKKRVLKLKEQNLFQVLELDPKADSAAVKAAYFKMARIYHPDTVTPDAPPELAKLKGEVFHTIGEAYRRLGEDKSRAEYLDEMQHGGGEKVDVAQILMAEELFQKGCILVKARKFAEAVKMLDEAIAANDKEGEFYAWRGYAKFFTHTDKAKGKADAHRDFQVALKMNERVASLHYFMGHVAKLTGDNTSALKYFKRAIELNPDHIDAQRELRMMGPAKR